MTALLHRAFIAVRDIGVGDQDAETVRRLRTLNVVAVVASVATASYCLFYVIYDAAFFEDEILFLLAATAAYPVTLLATRARQVEGAMWILVLTAFTHLGIINWMLGPGAGALSYLLTAIFIMTLFVRDNDRLSIWPIALGTVAIFLVVTFGGHEGTVAALPQSTVRTLFAVNVMGAVLMAGAIALFFRWLIARAEENLQEEKARGDRLLLAILPEAIAEQLKRTEGQTIAERCDSATVLIADIVGFTPRSARTDPDRLVADLNTVFSRADELAEKHGVERIKTLGDGYLALAGLPERAPDHAARMAAFALDLRRATSELAGTAWPGLALRIAIHTGPVVAGVIGRTKFAYDVWGDTVNTVARMEEVCAPREILLTEPAAAALPAGAFRLGERRTVTLRDKGETTVIPLEG